LEVQKKKKNRCKSSSYLTPPISGPPRLLPIASISSIKIIEGENDLAFPKRSLTRDAATPTNIWEEKTLNESISFSCKVPNKSGLKIIRTSLIKCNISHFMGTCHHEVHPCKQKEYCEAHDVDTNS